mmetsp:Transcript_63210/g.175282  ORF Transcript_63210/g.175282 Transcript_63210/m.175282 type:complete len:310 (+) Transcript_63210:71-1000(+)
MGPERRCSRTPALPARPRRRVVRAPCSARVQRASVHPASARPPPQGALHRPLTSGGARCGTPLHLAVPRRHRLLSTELGSSSSIRYTTLPMLPVSITCLPNTGDRRSSCTARSTASTARLETRTRVPWRLGRVWPHLPHVPRALNLLLHPFQVSLRRRGSCRRQRWSAPRLPSPHALNPRPWARPPLQRLLPLRKSSLRAQLLQPGRKLCFLGLLSRSCLGPLPVRPAPAPLRWLRAQTVKLRSSMTQARRALPVLMLPLWCPLKTGEVVMEMAARGLPASLDLCWPPLTEPSLLYRCRLTLDSACLPR